MSQLRIQLFRYIIVGILSNVTLILLFGILRLFGIQDFIALTITYLIGASATLVLNGRWTFTSLTKQDFWPKAVKYFSLYGVGLVISIFSYSLITSELGVPAILAQTVTVFICAVFLFIGQRSWVFRKPSR